MARAPFGELIARRLQETKNSGNPIYTEVLFVLDPQTNLGEFVGHMEARRQYYVLQGVANQLCWRVVPMHDRAGLEVLLVDEKDAFFLFPILHGTADIQKGIFFDSQPEICRELVAWFERRVKDGSEDFNEWSKRVQAR